MGEVEVLPLIATLAMAMDIACGIDGYAFIYVGKEGVMSVHPSNSVQDAGVILGCVSPDGYIEFVTQWRQ